MLGARGGARSEALELANFSPTKLAHGADKSCRPVWLVALNWIFGMSPDLAKNNVG